MKKHSTRAGLDWATATLFAESGILNLCSPATTDTIVAYVVIAARPNEILGFFQLEAALFLAMPASRSMGRVIGIAVAMAATLASFLESDYPSASSSLLMFALVVAATIFHHGRSSTDTGQ